MYAATPGLFELLFRKKRGDVTQMDRKNYAQTVIAGNCNRKSSDPHGPIIGNHGLKYRKYIQPIVDENSLGAGKGSAMNTLKLSNKRIEYIHSMAKSNCFGDPSKSTDGVQVARHRGHDNKITYIVNALRKAHYIKGTLNETWLTNCTAQHEKTLNDVVCTTCGKPTWWKGYRIPNKMRVTATYGL